MIISRLLSLIFRFAEFVCAMVVVGINGYFLHVYHKTHNGPLKREIYIEVIAGIAALASLIWMLPFTSAMMHYPFDLIMVAAWFAAFALQVNQIHSTNCGNAFHWGGLQKGGYCGQWHAAEAFSFMSAIFWLASALLGVYVFHKLRKQGAYANNNTTTTRRRRWGRSAV